MEPRWLFGNLAVAALALGTILSMFPLWKSATLSPDSIKRRTYWTGTVATMVFGFLAAQPNWRGGLFVAAVMGLSLLGLAFRYTSHLKIGGKIYGMPGNRGPDRPPALANRSRPD